MQKNLVVDASVFISSLLENDINHKISRDFFAKIKKKRMVIVLPISVFFEVLHVYGRVINNQEKIDSIYKEVIDANIDGRLKIMNIEAAFLTHFGAFHQLFSIKTADAIVALAAHRLKCPLISLDKQLLVASKKHATAMTPEEFLKN